MSETIQNLIATTAENRIKAGNYDKEIMLGNLGLLLANMQLRAEQYEHLVGLINPVVENTETNTEASA